MKKKTKRRAVQVLETFQEESGKIGIQGLTRILQTKQNVFGRVFWTFVVSSMVLLASVWSYLMYQVSLTLYKNPSRGSVINGAS